MPTSREIIFSSFLADSLSLGTHWEYDQQRIANSIGNLSGLLAPRLTNYHMTKEAGDLSHYGDQMLVLLQSIHEHNGFDLDAFADGWKKFMGTYTGYIDHASRDTMRHFSEGLDPSESGGHSSDFSAAARIAPLFTNLTVDLDQLIADARAQALMTHNNLLVADGAEFFTRTTFALLNGAPIKEAFDIAADTNYLKLPAEDWLAFTYMSADEEPLKAIEKFGQSCGMKGAFHGVVHLATTMCDQPQQALIANAMAGGETCARGIMLGLLFGAMHGKQAYSEEWAISLRCRNILISLTDVVQ